MVSPGHSSVGATLPDSARMELASDPRDDRAAVIRLTGDWRGQLDVPLEPLDRALSSGGVQALAFDTAALEGWNSATLVFVEKVLARCEAYGAVVDRSGLPGGVQRLIALSEAVPEIEDARPRGPSAPILDRIGHLTVEAGRSLTQGIDFLGAATLALVGFVRGHARFRRVDLSLLIQQSGAEALPIVTLVSFLLGVILAFVAAIQLEQFGATIYVANLVGIAMVRDMGALITAIVMAGRSGAAFAAEIGSMKVSQEIDALTTMGISPMEYLVLPRVIALLVMMPLLCVYADFVGILGGLAVGATLLDLSFTAYVQQTVAALGMGDLIGGLFKASVYGVLVALAGCLRGMAADRSSAGVGAATTSAVVTGIVAIIAACGLFQIVFYVLRI